MGLVFLDPSVRSNGLIIIGDGLRLLRSVSVQSPYLKRPFLVEL